MGVNVQMFSVYASKLGKTKKPKIKRQFFLVANNIQWQSKLTWNVGKCVVSAWYLHVFWHPMHISRIQTKHVRRIRIETQRHCQTLFFLSTRLICLDSILQPISVNFTVNWCTQIIRILNKAFATFNTHTHTLWSCVHVCSCVHLTFLSFFFYTSSRKIQCHCTFVLFLSILMRYDFAVSFRFVFFSSSLYSNQIYLCMLVHVILFAFSINVFAHLPSENGYLDTKILILKRAREKKKQKMVLCVLKAIKKQRPTQSK